jgi:hypothetical protein
VAKKTSKTAPSASRRKISLKKIIAEIDKVLSELDKPAPRARSTTGPDTVAKARLSLKAARSAIESVCVPNFEFPE